MTPTEQDKRTESMWRTVGEDPSVTEAQAAYATVFRLVRDRLPEPDRWLLGELDDAHGASIAAHTKAGAAWAQASS